MAAARAGEYQALRVEAEAAARLGDADRARALRRLRAELRRLRRRDFFPPPERDAAIAAINQLAASTASTTTSDTPAGAAHEAVTS
jgi:hypothetical protein